MNDSQHDRITKIFIEACELLEDQREEFVQRQAAGDKVVFSRVIEMLAADSDTTGSHLLSDQVIDAGLHFQIEEGVVGEQRPSEISRFKILREIGRGGMGVVYEAMQMQPERTVAIKVIRSGLISSQAKQRFKREAQLLGRLQHAGIAQIYEAGSLNDEDGDQPYIAMELVDGVPIKSYCKDQGLNTKQRLELVKKIADALHHAHQKGVVHRDLKPDNVLIVPGESPQPKILDFGVARVSSSESLVPITIQGHHQIIGTLDYMSPEQVSGSVDVDIRTDVYALGVLAFELISGKRPFDLTGLQVVAAAKVITDQTPDRLSSIDTGLRGDIETLISTAMSHDPADRYQSAAEMSADIGRYLRGEPITAHPPSTRYHFYKFVTRNKPMVCMSILAIFALVGGLVFTSIALGEAKAKTKLSDALYEFITINLLEQANPDLNDQRDPTIRMLLDRANEELDDQFKDDPQIELKLRETIRSAYKSLGAYDQAMSQSVRMIALAEPLYGREDNRTLRKMHGLSTDLLDLSRFEDALDICLEVYEIRKDKLGINHLETLQIMNNLGACHMRLGNFKDASIVLEEALEGKEIVLGIEDLSTINTRHNLGSLKLSMGQYEDAERLLKVVIEQRVAQLGSSHPRVTRSRSVLAATYFLKGEYEKCVEITNFAIKSIGDRLEPNHPMRLNLELTSIRALSGTGNHIEAWRRAKEHKASFKSEGSMYPEWLHRSAAIAHLAGDSKAAVQLYDECIDDHYDKKLTIEEPEFYIDFASALESNGDIQRSIDAIKHAIETLSDLPANIIKREELELQLDRLRNLSDVQGRSGQKLIGENDD